MEEDSVNDNVPGSVIADERTDQPVQYEIVESSEQRGRKTNLARQADRKRQISCPVEPSDLEFELNPQHMPSKFLKADVKVGHWRHLVFSTSDILSLLAKSKQWYVIIGLN